MEREIDFLVREIIKKFFPGENLESINTTNKPKLIGYSNDFDPRFIELLSKHNILHFDKINKRYNIDETKIYKLFDKYNKKHPRLDPPILHPATFEFISQTITQNFKGDKLILFLYDCNCEEELIKQVKDTKTLTDLIRYLSHSDNKIDRESLKNIIEEICNPLYNRKHKQTVSELNRHLETKQLCVKYSDTDKKYFLSKLISHIKWHKNHISYNQKKYTPNNPDTQFIIEYGFPRKKIIKGKLTVTFTLKQINNNSGPIKINKESIASFRKGLSNSKIPLKISEKGKKITIQAK